MRIVIGEDQVSVYSQPVSDLTAPTWCARPRPIGPTS